MDNIGKYWTESEDENLLNELLKEIPIKEISKVHKRSNGAIISRINFLIRRMYKNNISIDEIVIRTKKEEQEIMEIINKKSKKNIDNTNEEIEELKNKVNILENTLEKLVNILCQGEKSLSCSFCLNAPKYCKCGETKYFFYNLDASNYSEFT